MNSSKSSSFSTLRVVSSFSHSHSSFLVKLTLVTLCNASSSCGISHRRINIGTYFFCGLPASLEKRDYIINVFGSHSEFLDQRFFCQVRGKQIFSESGNTLFQFPLLLLLLQKGMFPVRKSKNFSAVSVTMYTTEAVRKHCILSRK